MSDYRCFECRNLLFRARLVVADIELKCPKCNAMNTWRVSIRPLDIAYNAMVSV